MALVPSSAVIPALANPYKLAAARIVYQNRKDLWNASKASYGAARRAINRYSARRRQANKKAYVMKKRNSQVGEKPGTSLTKQNQYRSDGATAHNGNVLNSIELLQIDRMNSTFSLNHRLRDCIYLSGFKVCFSVTNLDAATFLYFNVALISAKNRGSIGDGVDFFRSYQGASRSNDFSDATLNAMDRHCLPINTDEHVVHFHERRTIVPSSDSCDNNPLKVAKTFKYETWVPIKRQIRFEGDAPLPETKFQLVHWAGAQGAPIAASQAPITNAYNMDVKVIAFFKEPLPVLEYR